MIWFACKQCGKPHGRPDNLSGTLVFCECGQGNRVPWASTIAEPETPPEPAPAPRPRAPRTEGAAPPRGVIREARRPDPAFCLEHTERASTHTCAACGCSFCPACVVTLQGQTLCGPCKNFRTRGMQRPARVAALPIVALVLALLSGPVTLVLGLAAIGFAAGAEGGTVRSGLNLALVGLVLPAASLVLGLVALRQVETRPGFGGRAMAMTGTTTALAGVLWCLALVLILFLKLSQD